MHCHLLVPDLFWPGREFREIYRGLDAPALVRLVSKGRRRQAQTASLETWLCEQFSVERQQDWPVAPYSLLADGGEPGRHHWFRADPVHLKLEGGRLVLADSSTFSISQQEAESLSDSLNAHFSADSLTFYPLRPDRWYLRSETAPALETTELAAAAGRSIDTLLPRGGDAQIWRTRLNEVQMLLHGHAVNEERVNAGKVPINSVWLWGGGKLSDAVSAPFDAVRSRNPFAAGLAQAARLAARDLPDSAADWLRASASEGVNLIVLDRLRGAAQYGDAHGWREGMQQLERDWFAPLLEALRQERIGMLSLHALGPEGAFSAEVTRGDLRRFWRRVKPLADYA
ncbi:MAG: phosphoglycerate mutase [Betaproteobacteria bacterium]|nr:phosphoglycerate mutase [Betaproteobacteria bacterium]